MGPPAPGRRLDALGDEGVGVPCQEQDVDLWFAEQPQLIEIAKQWCRTCPVRRECLAGALDRREPWGVWGGELLARGAILAHKRPRGRPRKEHRVA